MSRSKDLEKAQDALWAERLPEQGYPRDRDGVAALHDVEAESGDEEALLDAFELDRAEAHDLRVDLDGLDDAEPLLD